MENVVGYISILTDAIKLKIIEDKETKDKIRIVGVQKNGGSFIYDELQKYIICLDQVKLIFLM